MNERDKKLANQVTWYADVTLTELSRYANLIRADEREACATVCESHVRYPSRLHFAQAIRARGQAKLKEKNFD
jgi:hypothetical protein